MIARKLLIGTISSLVAVVGTSSIVFAGVAFVEHRQEIPTVSAVVTTGPSAPASSTSVVTIATTEKETPTVEATQVVADDWGGATSVSDDANATDDKAKTQVEAVQVSPTATTVQDRSSTSSTTASAAASTTSTTICDTPGDGVADDGAAHDATDDKGGAAGGGHGHGRNDVAPASTTPVTAASTAASSTPSNTVPSGPPTSAEVHGGRGGSGGGGGRKP
jgi:hypothetical protein